jgi:hypothetical protein
MNAINMEIVYNKSEIPNCLKDQLSQYSETVLLALASALHGGRISAATQREKTFAKKANAVKQKGCWDFKFEKQKLMVDLKSPGFDHNTPVELFAKKYLDNLPVGFTGVFVVQEITGQRLEKHWPIAKLAAYGLIVMNETDFFERYL